MQYILTSEELESLVPKEELKDLSDQLNAVIDALRNTDFCVQHQYGRNSYCDDCPISSLNLTIPKGKYWGPCSYQNFSK